jgi:hypothetical protein
VAISSLDLGGASLGPADESIHVTNGRAAFNDAANSSVGVGSVDQTQRNDYQMTNTRERLVRRAFESKGAVEWSLNLDAMLEGIFLTKEPLGRIDTR